MSQFESMSLSEHETSDFREPEVNSEMNNEQNRQSEPIEHPSSQEQQSSGHESQESSSGVDEEHQREPKYKQIYEQFIKEMDAASEPELKLQKAIDFMESSLAQSTTPHFKSFWDARALALDLFKQNISSSTRANLWNKYTELSKEARRLKEILEEQSAFAVEQIEVAVAALEKEIQSNAEHLTQGVSFEFPIDCKSLEKKYPYYKGIQVELNLLNAQASRINALRKELIKTEMRIRQKNKFFQRLSSAGDLVFPRRKELIKEISQHFVDDVDAFIRENFSKTEIQDSLFFLREEIKSLQGMAKLLTLNTHSFTHTRLRLSECWDKIKEFEKDRKKARANQKVLFKQNQESVQQKIVELSETFSANKNISEALKLADDVTSYMRQVELGRDELKILRDELYQAKQPIFDQQKKEEREKHDQEQERERQRNQLILTLRNECETLIQSVDALDAEKLTEEKDLLLDKIARSSVSKMEKQELEKILKPLRDIIADKRERALLDLSEDDRQKLEHLKELLKEKKERRQEIKNQLEVYRKAKSGSGFDFGQAMNTNEQIATEKERLEKVIQGIKEIEEMIEKIENQ